MGGSMVGIPWYIYIIWLGIAKTSVYAVFNVFNASTPSHVKAFERLSLWGHNFHCQIKTDHKGSILRTLQNSPSCLKRPFIVIL